MRQEKENKKITVTERTEKTPKGIKIIKTSHDQYGKVVKTEVLEKSGGGGSGSGGNSDGAEENYGEKKPRLMPVIRIDEEGKPLAEKESEKTAGSTGQLALNSQAPKPEFNEQIILDLLLNKQLLITNDRALGVLTIKLQCNPKLLSNKQKDELKKFTDHILKKLGDFKKENGISNNCVVVERDNENNVLSLRITMPTLQMYNVFIQRLTEKNLLPMQNQNGQLLTDKPTLPEESNAYRTPTPFSIDGPKPYGITS